MRTNRGVCLKDEYRETKVVPWFNHYTEKAQYEFDGVKWCEPMTAKEIESEETQDEILADTSYIVEEKFDGTRATLHFEKQKEVDYSQISCDNKVLVDALVQRGSITVGWSERVYKHFLEEHSLKDSAEFLKNEFGMCGYSMRDYYIDSNAKGITVSSNQKVVYTWTTIAKIYEELVSRGYLAPQTHFTRCFSRRVSKKTDWFCENTDSLPHLRVIEVPGLEGTVIDGEMFIPDRPFKDVSSTLNCNWDKAIDRQVDLGEIVFHAFDILYYKGVRVEKMSLERRKYYLHKVVEEINSPYVQEVPYYYCGEYLSYDNGTKCSLSDMVYKALHHNEEAFDFFEETLMDKEENFPNLVECWKSSNNFITPRAWYELIVLTGGEGCMLKPIEGQYWHKRSKEYLKIKKFLTREMILIGFEEPTKEYKGKFPNDSWEYWEHHGEIVSNNWSSHSAKELKKKGMIPVSKFYAENWVGNLKLGVLVTQEDLDAISKNKRGTIYYPSACNLDSNLDKDHFVMEVCVCGGFDEEQRAQFTDLRDNMIGKVVEVKANEIFKDSGKLRHPRFLRMREDKEAERCVWEDHISSEYV